ncbi:uncharacterized protein STEHIDRAFT_27185, partial [Stereum hirsutum FP-91666 SS1]|uniref:uncharacterized protein n=1 Tax=Stereum hirsutum (strain FP-91666) TaxID=721885 RepID=UPI000444A36E
LPKVAADATSRLETCDAALSGLPQPLDTEPATYMLSLITALCEDVKTVVEGLQKNQSLDTKLIQGNRKIYAVFKDNIRSTCPNFAPRKRNDKNVSDSDGESDAESEDSANPPIYLDDMRSHITNSVKRELPNNVPYEAKVKLI